MKQVSNIGHWPLAIGLSVLWTLTSASEAHAGWSGPVYTVTSRTPASNSPQAGSIPSGGSGGPVSSTITTKSAKGTVKSTFTWSPDPTSDSPPETLSVFEKGSASWRLEGTEVGNEPTGNEDGSASNGMGDEQQFDGSGATSQGIHLKTYSVSDNQVVTDSITLDAHCTGPNATAGWFYSAVIDSRSVKLSRGVTALKADTSHLKKNKEEWVDKDGAGHGSTLASYAEKIVTGGDGIILDPSIIDDPRDIVQTLITIPTGGWSSNDALNYQWTPSNTTQGLRYHIEVMPQSNAVNNPDGIDSPFTFSVEEAGWTNHPSSQKGAVINFTYELTDTADNAKATAKYELNLHDEWEEAIDDPQFKIGTQNGVSKGERYYVFSDLYAHRPTPPEAEPIWKINGNAKFSVELGVELSAGFKLKDLINIGLSGEAKADVDVSVAIEQPARPLSGFTNAGGTTKFFRIIQFQMEREHKLVDKFGVDGLIPNPTTQGLPRTDARWSKWPQSKDKEPGGFTPNWLRIDPEDNRVDPNIGEKGGYDPTTGKSAPEL